MIRTEELKQECGVEMTVVILSCRVYFKTATIEELTQFIEVHNPDWTIVRKICRNHRIRPVVLRVLASARIPKEQTEVLKRDLQGLTGRSWKLAMETERLLMLLMRHGIKATPYKGAAYSVQFYGDLVSRESGDIDLMIRSSDLEAVIRLLIEDGYQSERSLEYECLGKKYFDYYKDFTFNKPEVGGLGFHVEFHWKIAEDVFAVRSPSASLLEKSGTDFQMVRSEVPGLSPEAHYVSVFIHHAVKDGFKSLKHLMDLSIMGVQDRFAPNWEFIRWHMWNLRLKKVYSLGGMLSEALFGVNLPASGYELPPHNSKYFIRQLTSVQVPVGHILQSTKAFRSRVYLCDTWVDQVRFFLAFARSRFIPSGVDFRVIRLPRFLFFAYYLLKPVRSLLRPTDPREERKRNTQPGVLSAVQEKEGIQRKKEF